MIIAGTGHRPNKLGGYGEEVRASLIELAKDVIIGESPRLVISGGALGWDQALADAAVELGSPLTLALPFPGFDSTWPYHSRKHLDLLCMRAKEVVWVSDDPTYEPWKMQERNVWMVDRCDQVVALWDGTKGGTYNCIKYAKKKGKPIINLWEQYDERFRQAQPSGPAHERVL